MKVIPTNELIILLQHCDYKTLNLGDMERLFEYYGDDYYADQEFTSSGYMTKNAERENFIELALIAEGAKRGIRSNTDE